MTIRWTVSTDDTGTDVRWECRGLAVAACLYDTDEWVVRYGRGEATEVFTRTSDYDDAIADAETCMKLLTTGRVDGVDARP